MKNLEMAQLKVDGKCKVLVVSGCLPQRYSKELESRCRVDLHRNGPISPHHRAANAHGKALTERTLPKRSYIDQPAFILKRPGLTPAQNQRLSKNSLL